MLQEKKNLLIKKMSCQPNDFYCMSTNPGDKFLISFYSQNTGISGPLRKTNRNQELPDSFHGNFVQTEFLPYADISFREMKGSSVFTDPKFAEYNAFKLPSNYFTRLVLPKENCSCSKRKSPIQ